MYTRIQFVSDTIKGNGHCKKSASGSSSPVSTVRSLRAAGCLSETKVLAAFFEYGEYSRQAGTRKYEQVYGVIHKPLRQNFARIDHLPTVDGIPLLL